ncbi:MAG: hypothetical protein LBD51_07960 [Bifidobacteriaceae bacterium]|jgi:hypothetical protein|nr:hypothetical protein [Bifidobacteriaceae bacterium]
MRSLGRFALGAAVAAGAAIAVGSRLHRGWGASAAERACALPGDDLVEDPVYRSTRAITIEAPPEAVWPWLVQMGMGRAGWYSNDRLLGLISPGPTESASAILECYQDLKVGDPVDLILPMGFKVAELIPNQALVLFSEELMPMQPWRKSWVFALRPLPGGATRLLVRETSAWDSWLVGLVTSATAWAWFLGTRRQLKNLKALVEAS